MKRVGQTCLSSLRYGQSQNIFEDKRGLVGICRVLTGRPLFVARWVYWIRARVSGKLYRRSSSGYGWEAGTDAIIPAVE